MSKCPDNVLLNKTSLPLWSTRLPNTFVFSWDLPTAVDNADPNIEVVCKPEPGTEFTVGVTVVQCNVTDESGNQDKCSFNVTVQGLLILCRILA